jgi:hypothetical protein
MTGQPNVQDGFGNAVWEFDIARIDAIEKFTAADEPVSPGVIINQPNHFALQTTLSNVGQICQGIHGQPGEVRYHAQKLEDGTVATLAPTPFTMGAASQHIVTSQDFTSGPGNDLDVGTWLVTVYARFNTPPHNSMVAAFNQTILMVI